MKPRSFSPASIAAVKMRNVGQCFRTCRMPSGEATRLTSRTCRTEFFEQPHRRHRATARGQHRIDQDDFALWRRSQAGSCDKTALPTFLSALQSDKTDARFGMVAN